MYHKSLPRLLVLSLLLTSCRFSCKLGSSDTGESKPSSTTVSSYSEVNGTVLTNGISLTANGVKVKSATLQLADKSRVPDDNVVAENEKVYLMIQLEEPWTVENGKSFIGASEVITGSNGTVVLNAADLFKDYSTTGVDPEDAKYLQLNAVITRHDPANSYYTVDFRVWDKKSDAEIKGSYKFYIRKE